MANMKKIFLIFNLLVLTVVVNAQKQDSTATSYCPKFSIGFSPMGIAINRIRFELETGVNKKSPILLSVAPIIYSGTTSQYNNTRNIPPDNSKNSYSTDNVGGVGGELMAKFTRITDPIRIKMIYGGVGLGYHNINLTFEDYNWTPYQQDGLEYYSYNLGPQEETIKRVDVFGVFGGRIYVNKAFYLDGNVGLMYQKSSISSTLLVNRDHLNGPLDYGYTGLNYRFNFTVGISLF